jgi:hypothetical protein
MANKERSADMSRRARQAAVLWLVFIFIAIILNGTIPFILGIDLHSWTSSITKSILVSAIIYAALFLVAPLILEKSWEIVRQPAFLIPLVVAIAGIILWSVFPVAAAVVVFVLLYLHYRFNLSKLGIHSTGWRGDLEAVLFLGLLQLPFVFTLPGPYTFSLATGLIAGFERLFANPATTVEYFFYFGFLTERFSGFLTQRFSYRTGRILTVPLVGAMYTMHEVSNPEYWYGGMSFVLTFFGIMVFTVFYLWRRSVFVNWLGDGLGKLLIGIF